MMATTLSSRTLLATWVQTLITEQLLENVVKRHIKVNGSIETDMRVIGRLLLERYRGVLRDAGYPVLRLEDEKMGYRNALSDVEVHGHRGDDSQDDESQNEDDETEHDYKLEVEGEAAKPQTFTEDVQRLVASRNLKVNHMVLYQLYHLELMNKDHLDHYRPCASPPRNPVAYPHLTWDEIDGTRYPGEGAGLSQFSDYERMTRLCQCYEARLVTMEYNDREGHEHFV